MNQLRPYQLHECQEEELASAIVKEIAGSHNAVARFPAIGIGKTAVILESLSRVGDKNKAVLVACPAAMVNQWSHEIQRWIPSARVFFYGTSLVNGAKYQSFTQIMPNLGMSYTFDYLATVEPAVWRLQQKRPSFSLVAFPHIARTVARFEQWFDYAIQDESFPTVKMDKISVDLHHVAKTLVRIQLVGK